MHCPKLSELPEPLVGKTSWLWTEESERRVELASQEEPWPRISVIPPSFNQGQFLEEFKEELILPVAAMILMFGGYYLVYILTPHDLTAHLHTSLNRHLMQLWPRALFLYFLIVRTPEEVSAIYETRVAISPLEPIK